MPRPWSGWYTSSAILEQTEKLGSPHHPYRRKKLDTLFNGRVRVYSKEELLVEALQPGKCPRTGEYFVLNTRSAPVTRKAARPTRKTPSCGPLRWHCRRQASFAPPKPTPRPDQCHPRHAAGVHRRREPHNAGSVRLPAEMLENFNPSLINDLTRHPHPEQHHQLRGRGPAQGEPHGQAAGVYNHHSSAEVINAPSNCATCWSAREERRAGGDSIRSSFSRPNRTPARRTGPPLTRSKNGWYAWASTSRRSPSRPPPSTKIERRGPARPDLPHPLHHHRQRPQGGAGISSFSSSRPSPTAIRRWTWSRSSVGCSISLMPGSSTAKRLTALL